jgi:hypothetical protein
MKGHPRKPVPSMKREQMVLVAVLVFLALAVMIIQHASFMVEEEGNRKSMLMSTSTLTRSTSSAPGTSTRHRYHAHIQEEVTGIDKTGFWIEKLLDSPRM